LVSLAPLKTDAGARPLTASWFFLIENKGEVL